LEKMPQLLRPPFIVGGIDVWAGIEGVKETGLRGMKEILAHSGSMCLCYSVILRFALKTASNVSQKDNRSVWIAYKRGGNDVKVQEVRAPACALVSIERHHLVFVLR
jgi:hypothetical protein